MRFIYAQSRPGQEMPLNFPKTATPATRCTEMKCLHFPCLSLVTLLVLPVTVLARAFHVTSSLVDSSNTFGSRTDLKNDEGRFSIAENFGETDLPVTPLLMNAVELTAHYAAKDFRSSARQRHGIVLPQYPQLEIAIIPAAPATSIEVRQVVWALYAIAMDMVVRKIFKECEATIFWDDKVVGHVYFTEPIDATSSGNHSSFDAHRARLAGMTHATPPSNTTLQALDADADQFGWKPYYRPNAKNLLPTDVFALALGTIKVIAPFAGSDRVPGPLQIGSDHINANLQVYLRQRRVPRQVPPFFLYTHVLEAVRRLPGWMLDHRRFAEAFCPIEVATKPVGAIVVEKGSFIPGLQGADGNVSVS
ncbi:MAG: hypothetical protein L6R39_002715 [Caloplaca ligustica]|nr:MAG: hypothetical protein L6R39_002715 [Caloplaca ligustica]